MGWLPDTPDELFGAIVILVVLGAVSLVLIGRLVLWVAGWPIWRQSVNGSSKGGADYVARRDGDTPSSGAFPQEREPEREPERAERTDQTPPAVDGRIYTASQIETLKAEARDAGAAEALGRLLGRQLVDNADRALAMELIFGKRGRRHQLVRPLVEAAAAAVAPAAADARLVPINDGAKGHVEL